MNYLGLWADLAIIACPILHLVLGWRRGFLWQVAGLASLCFGVGLGWLLAPVFSGIIQAQVASDPLRAKLLVFLFVFGVVGVTLRLVASWAEVQAERGLPKEEKEKRRKRDRVLGGMFGVFKGLILTAILVAAGVTLYPRNEILGRSYLAGSMARAGSRMLPDGAVKEVREWAKQQVTSISRNLEIE